MRIAFVNSTHKWGGVKTWTLELAVGLQQRFNISSMIIGRQKEFLTRAKELGLKARPFSFGPDYNPKAVCQFIKLFKREKITHIVVNVGKDMRTAGIGAKLLGIPVLHRVGLPGDMKDKFDVRLMYKWIRPKLIVPCEFIKQGLLQNLPFLHSENVKVIYTGKEACPFPPQRVNVPLQFISTSQLNPDKGHQDVLRALALLKKRGVTFHYHVLGTGKSQQKLQQLALELDLKDRITWYGFQKDVRKFLRRADVFILASYSEGLPNSLLEAMAEGLVCVSRNVGGIKEVWPNGLEALLFSRQTSLEELANLLIYVANMDLLTTKRIFWKNSQGYYGNMLQEFKRFLTER